MQKNDELKVLLREHNVTFPCPIDDQNIVPTNIYSDQVRFSNTAHENNHRSDRARRLAWNVRFYVWKYPRLNKSLPIYV